MGKVKEVEDFLDITKEAFGAWYDLTLDWVCILNKYLDLFKIDTGKDVSKIVEELGILNEARP